MNNKATAAQLLRGFFNFYATFDYDSLLVAPFVGHTVPKSCFKEDSGQRDEQFETYYAKLGQEDPRHLYVETCFCVQVSEPIISHISFSPAHTSLFFPLKRTLSS